jgi:hypothetical protein
MKELSNGILDFNGKSSDNRECSFSLFVGVLGNHTSIMLV